MIKKISILYIFSFFGMTHAMQKDGSLIKVLLSQPVNFTSEEKNLLQKIDATYTNVSMWELGRMKGQVNTIVEEKITSAKHCDKNLNQINDAIQKMLTGRICKKIDNCCLITSLLSTAGFITYGAALAIHGMQ